MPYTIGASMEKVPVVEELEVAMLVSTAPVAALSSNRNTRVATENEYFIL
jgi:hypothetical protein